MVAVQELEHFIDNKGVAQPDLYLVPDLETAPEQYEPAEVIEHQTGVEVSKATGDVLIGVVVQVNGQPYDLCVNVSRKTLGNNYRDLPIRSFFERFESQGLDAQELAKHALYLAQK